MKVGRAALDEDAIRLIEQLNPGVEFDWTRILKGQGTPATEPRPPVEARRQRPDGRRPPSPPPPSSPRPASPPVQSLPRASPEAERAPAAIDPEPVGTSGAIAGPLRPVDEPIALATFVPPENDVPTPAHAKLGSEGVQRLRARYAEILVRISERTADPARQEELKAQADRLNPDSWVTDGDVVQGLEQYEAVFASLREVVGQKRRRRRRGSRPRTGDAPGESSGTELAGAPDAADLPESPDSDGRDGDSRPDES